MLQVLPPPPSYSITRFLVHTYFLNFVKMDINRFRWSKTYDFEREKKSFKQSYFYIKHPCKSSPPPVCGHVPQFFFFFHWRIFLFSYAQNDIDIYKPGHLEAYSGWGEASRLEFSSSTMWKLIEILFFYWSVISIHFRNSY